MWAFTDPIALANSITLTLTGEASSAITFSTGAGGTASGSSSATTIQALAGRTQTILNDQSSVTYTEASGGIFGITTSFATGGSSTDSGFITSPSSTVVGSLTTSQFTQTSTEVLTSFVSRITYSAFNTRNKQSSTFTTNASFRSIGSVTTFAVRTGLTETTITSTVPLLALGQRIRFYADTAGGEALLVYTGHPGAIWEGNAFITATSFQGTVHVPPAGVAVSMSAPLGVTSSLEVQNPFNGLTWNVTANDTGRTQPYPVNTFGTNTFTTSFPGRSNYTLSNFFTTSFLTTTFVTFLSTSGNLPEDATTFPLLSDSNYETFSTSIAGVSTSVDFLFESFPTGQNHVRPVVTSINTTASVSSVRLLSAANSYSITASGLATITTFDTGGSSHTTVITTSIVQTGAGGGTYSTFSDASTFLREITNPLSPPARIIPLPQGGWQVPGSAGPNLPIYQTLKQDVSAVEIGMWGGPLIPTATSAQATGIFATGSRQIRITADFDNRFLFGAPILRSSVAEWDRSPWGGIFANNVAGDNLLSSFFSSNFTALRTGSGFQQLVFEPLTVSTAESMSYEWGPGAGQGPIVIPVNMWRNE